MITLIYFTNALTPVVFKKNYPCLLWVCIWYYSTPNLNRNGRQQYNRNLTSVKPQTVINTRLCSQLQEHKPLLCQTCLV